MADRNFTIWCNASFTGSALELLHAGIGSHRLVLPEVVQKSILSAGGRDPLLDSADIAFGQPDATQIIGSQRLKWVQLTTAG